MTHTHPLHASVADATREIERALAVLVAAINRLVVVQRLVDIIPVAPYGEDAIDAVAPASPPYLPQAKRESSQETEHPLSDPRDDPACLPSVNERR